jgi:hypothetical protein
MYIIFMFFRKKEEGKDEKDISTEYQKKEEEPRLPQEDEHKVRKGYYKEEEAKRQKEVECLKAQWNP